MASTRPSFRAGTMPSASALDGLSRAVYEVRSGRGINAHVDGGRLFVEATADASYGFKVTQNGQFSVNVAAGYTIDRTGYDDRTSRTITFADPGAGNTVTHTIHAYWRPVDQWFAVSDCPVATQTEINSDTSAYKGDGGFGGVEMSFQVPVATIAVSRESMQITQHHFGDLCHREEPTGTVIMFSNLSSARPVGWEVYADTSGRIPVGGNGANPPTTADIAATGTDVESFAVTFLRKL